MEIRRDVWDHKRCPAEIGLNGDDFEGAGLRYGEERVEALEKHFCRFGFSRLVVQETDSEQNIEK